MVQPLLLSGSSHPLPAQSIFYGEGGKCFDPFVALINHACDPNTFLCFEGLKLRLRALNDIPTGAEITLCYQAGDQYQYTTKQILSDLEWNFRCNCAVCLLEQSPDEYKLTLSDRNNLHDRAWKLSTDVELVPNISDVQLAQIRCMIEEMGRNGYNLATKPTRRLYQLLLGAELSLGYLPGALHTSLKIYYHVDDCQIPPTSPPNRTITLYNLCWILARVHRADGHPQIYASHGKILSNSAFRAIKLAPEYLLLRRLASETTKWFGADSEAAIHANKVWQDKLTSKPAWHEDDFVQYIAALDDPAEKAELRYFAVILDELLKCAGSSPEILPTDRILELSGLQVLSGGLFTGGPFAGGPRISERAEPVTPPVQSEDERQDDTEEEYDSGVDTHDDDSDDDGHFPRGSWELERPHPLLANVEVALTGCRAGQSARFAQDNESVDSLD